MKYFVLLCFACFAQFFIVNARQVKSDIRNPNKDFQKVVAKPAEIKHDIPAAEPREDIGKRSPEPVPPQDRLEIPLLIQADQPVVHEESTSVQDDGAQANPLEAAQSAPPAAVLVTLAPKDGSESSINSSFASSNPFSVATNITATIPSIQVQAPIAFEDTSSLYISRIQALMGSGNYAGLFFHSFWKASKNATDLLSILNSTALVQKQSTNQSDATNQQKQYDSFFLTGHPDRRTKNNCYIVKVKHDAPNDAFGALKNLLATVEAKIQRTYQYNLKGYSVCFPPGQLPLAILRNVEWIEFVERDQIVSVLQTQEEAPWGLSRIDQPFLPLNNSFTFNLTGKGVTIYVVDSGADLEHSEFGGRATIGFSTQNDNLFGQDCAGHGTEVASVAAGTNVGVAKLANIVLAQVLDCTGQGQNSDLIAALDWIMRTAKKPAVINLSVGGPPSQSLDDAVSLAVRNGMAVVVAAGNSDADACNFSPSGTKAAITVGASNQDDTRASFSNYGKCVDIFAPGHDILAAAAPGKDTAGKGFVFSSGTSLATPFVSGIIALLLQNQPGLTPLELSTMLTKMAVPNVMMQSTIFDSPNLLLQAPPADNSNGQLVNLLPPGSLPTLSSSTGHTILEWTFIGVGSGIGLLSILFTVIFIIRRRQRNRELSRPRANPIIISTPA